MITSLLRAFALQSRGNVAIMTALLSVPLMAIAGGGMDLAVQFQSETRLQTTLDAAVIAASSLNQPLAAKDVINSYLLKAGIAGIVPAVTDTRTTMKRVVKATAHTTTNTTFLSLLHIKTLDVNASAAAEESAQNLEMSMVLDISDSMTQDGRIEAALPAARAFFDQVLAGTAKDRTTLSLIPFGGEVSVGKVMYQEVFGGKGPPTAGYQTNSWCFENLSTAATLSVPNFATAKQVPHFRSPANVPYRCPLDETSIVYLSNDPDALKTKLNGLNVYYGTGTQMGMQWGLNLLNPAFRPYMNNPKSGVAAKFASRPSAFNDPDTVKVIVLMTDGAVTKILRPSAPTVPVDRPKAIAAMTSVCNLAKANGVTIYTIGFDIEGGKDGTFYPALQDCASSIDKFYDATTEDIGDVLSDIANRTSPLRLTN